MTSDKKNIILFTGQSGIKVERCLENLNKPHINGLKIFLVENYIKKEYDGNFRTFLTEPIPTQSALWDRSFDNLYEELFQFKNNFVFLSMHASYYHQDTCELVSVIDFKRLFKLKDRIKMVIVFIDDIFDIYKRLLKKGEMFSKVMHYDVIYRTLKDSILNLISILQWRQLEINISRLISRMMKIPFFIIATKHPVKWIRPLIDNNINDLNIYYLAHPISAIRKSSLEVIPDFSTEVNNFAKIFINKNERTVLFLPGTIDELRIKKIFKHKEDLTIPDLYPRLDLPYGPEYQIFPPLSGSVRAYNIFNPPNLDLSGLNSDLDKKISALLNQFSELVRLQVTSRDINLINQSKNGIVVYRPYFPGYISGGVNDEIEYNYILSQKEKSRKNIIISTKEDLAKARIRILFTQTLSKLGEDKVDDGLRKELENRREDWILNLERIEFFSSDEKIEKGFSEIWKELEVILPEDYFFADFSFKKNGTFKKGYFKALNKNRDENFQKIKKEILNDKLLDWVLKEDYHILAPSDRLNTNIIKKILEK